MKKRILAALILLAMVFSFLTLFFVKEKKPNYFTQETLTECIEPETESELENTEVSETEIIKVTKEPETKNYIEIAKENMRQAIENISSINDKEEWFVSYKDILKTYSDYIEIQTIYDAFSMSEIETLYRIVEAEVTGGDFISKVNVANVVLNRVKNEQFPNTISKVVFQEYQFSPVIDGRFYSVEISESTILAIEYAYMFEDTTNGALYFESGNNFVHMAYADYLFTDNVGHHFYK